MKRFEIVSCRKAFTLLGILLFSGVAFSEIPPNYTAKPFQDSIQQIPGRFFVWRYDQADARGISWQTPQKTLRTGEDYQYDGRKTAGVEDYIVNRIINPLYDVYGIKGHSYPANLADTIANPPGDTTLIYNDMKATKNGIYIAYVETGEWLKSTVNVAQEGYYQIDLMLTSFTSDPSIKISALNGTDSVSTGKIKFKDTGYYHNYVFQKNVATIYLKKGIQLIRTDITGREPFNLWFYKFTQVDKPTAIGELHENIGDVRAANLDDGSIQLSFHSLNESPMTVALFDSVGKMYGSETFSSVQLGSNNFRLATRPDAGLIFIRLTQGNESRVSKLIVPFRK